MRHDLHNDSLSENTAHNYLQKDVFNFVVEIARNRIETKAKIFLHVL